MKANRRSLSLLAMTAEHADAAGSGEQIDWTAGRSGDVVAGTVVLITYWQTNVCEKWRSCPMKKKSPRGIPDFAPKKPHLQKLDKLQLEKQPPKPPTVAPNIKPQATAAKGNRRGG